MLKIERLAARGSRGEACVVVRTSSEADAEGFGEAVFGLTTGERLRLTEDPKVLETLDGQRSFTLNQSP